MYDDDTEVEKQTGGDVEEPWTWGHIIESIVRVMFFFSYCWFLISIVIYNLFGHLQMRYQREQGIYDFFESQKEVLTVLIHKTETGSLLISSFIYAIYGILYLHTIKKLSPDDFLYRLLKVDK